MKSYSDYQGEKRTCQNCIFIDYNNGDDSVGMPGYLLCEKDAEGLLDIEDENGEIASRCPFWKDIDETDKLFHIFDIEILDIPATAEDWERVKIVSKKFSNFVTEKMLDEIPLEFSEKLKKDDA